MRDRERQIRLRVDAYTRFCLTALVVLMSVMIVGLWAEGVPSAAPAGAAGPSDRPVERYQPRSALDISELVAVEERTNAKLDEIKKLLESGQAKVQVVEGPAKDSGGDKNVQPTTTGSDTGVVRPGVHAN
ncbi:MAG: hypothetical protein MUP47_04610 [Phycisphaerae bacterium]|nr:hypothetical protein [Phycisphaerae bacterium]